jgi:heavy metal efflux system protein
LIDRLIEFSVRQRALVLVLYCVFILGGIAAAKRVAIDAVPDVTNVQVQVLTSAPALGPVDVETYVTTPVERAMAGLPDVEEIRSTTRAGISAVTISFDDSINVYFARQMVNERLARAKAAIPEGYGTPELGPISSGLGEIYHFEVKGPGKSLMELRSVLEWQIAPRLRLVPGIVEVNSFGGEAKTLEVTLDPARLAASNLGVTEVIDAIARNHLAVGGAHFTDGREHVTVRGEARVRGAEDLLSIVVDTRGETPLYVRDLATVQYAPQVRYGAVTRDGRGEAVVGVAMMLLGANSGKTVRLVKEALVDIGKSLPEGVTIDGYYDRTDLVDRTIKTVRTNLFEASALVIAVLFVTLASFRAGSIVTLAIPIALLGVFIGMWAIGLSGNLLSLGAIDFGLVVDGAIIIIENAQRRLSQEREHLGRPLTGEERSAVVISSSQEVRQATAFGEAIIALVYVPLLALEGVEGRMFRPMALTVLFALASAFVLSLTLVPAVASLVLSRNTHDRPSFFIRAADRIYRPSLAYAMRGPRVTVGIAFAVLVASLALFSRMGREFLPKLDEGAIVIATVRLPSASIEHAIEQTTRIETILKTFPEVTTVVCRTGRAEIAVDPMGMNMTDVYVLLRPREEWTTANDREGLVAAFDKALSDGVPGSGFSYTQPIEMNTNDLLAGIESDVAIHIHGHDLASLQRTGEKMVRVLRDVPGAADVRAEMVAGSNVLAITVDRTALGRYGIDAKVVLDAVSALGGIEVGTIVENGTRYPIQVRFNAESRKTASSISALPVRTQDGAILPLGQLATVSLDPGPSQVSREGLQRRLTVQLNVRGRDLGTFVDEARAALERDVRLPTGYYTAWAGEYERLESATLRLLLIVPITLALILVLLIATFGSIRPALLIFLNVPMAITGGVFGLALRGMDFSISAGVGFIALFGVAVLNGLVLVSSMERLRLRGVPVADAVFEAAESRLRPVLTTALVASLGFLPMALASGAGAEVQRPLATVVVGGIVSSTLLTLLVLPAVYVLATRNTPAREQMRIVNPEPHES